MHIVLFNYSAVVHHEIVSQGQMSIGNITGPINGATLINSCIFCRRHIVALLYWTRENETIIKIGIKSR